MIDGRVKMMERFLWTHVDAEGNPLWHAYRQWRLAMDLDAEPAHWCYVCGQHLAVVGQLRRGAFTPPLCPDCEAIPHIQQIVLHVKEATDGTRA